MLVWKICLFFEVRNPQFSKLPSTCATFLLSDKGLGVSHAARFVRRAWEGNDDLGCHGCNRRGSGCPSPATCPSQVLLSHTSSKACQAAWAAWKLTWPVLCSGEGESTGCGQPLGTMDPARLLVIFEPLRTACWDSLTQLVKCVHLRVCWWPLLHPSSHQAGS